MQSWVYLTLPEVKHIWQPVNQLPRNLLLLLPLGRKKKKKKCTFLFGYTPHTALQNPLENWKCPAHCSDLAQRRAHISLPPPPVTNKACQHCQKAQELMSHHTLHHEEENKTTKNQWLNKLLWDILLGLIIKMYFAFLDSAMHIGKENTLSFPQGVFGSHIKCL